MRPITDAERDTLITSLNCRSCFIETGTPATRAKDIQRLGPKGARELRMPIKALTTEQMKLLILHEELTTKLLTDKVFIED